MLDREFVEYVDQLANALRNISHLKTYSSGYNKDIYTKIEQKLFSKAEKLVRRTAEDAEGD
jgi:hypothetical protein